MPFRFKKHYSVDEAQALIPELRQWLIEIRDLRKRIHKLDQRFSPMLLNGQDPGGEMVHDSIKNLCRLKRCLSRFHEREIQVKDLERGLVDFPALVGGREVFLCWEQDEDTIEHWHDLESGYAGRERLPEA